MRCMAKGCRKSATSIFNMNGAYFWCQEHRLDLNAYNSDLAANGVSGLQRDHRIKEYVDSCRNVETHVMQSK